MFATVRRYETDSTLVPELLRRARKEFVPELRKINSFVSYDSVDSGKGVIVSMSVFETEAGADESNHLARKFAKDWSDLLPNPSQVTYGVIVLHETRS